MINPLELECSLEFVEFYFVDVVLCALSSFLEIDKMANMKGDCTV